MKSFSGIVVAQNNPKTVAVRVDRYEAHKKYKKIVRSTRRIQAHFNDEFSPKVGDLVTISPTRPLSATKRFLVTETKVKAKE